jgi:hypothetical protein
MEPNKQEMIFVDGMSFRARHEKAPETVRGSISIKYPDFTRFVEKHRDEKGWCNIKMMKSKEKGTIYFILDTWKPTSTPESQAEAKEYNDTKYQVNQEVANKIFDKPLTNQEELNLQDIPF